MLVNFLTSAFGAPRGPQGAAGSAGAQGPQGASGAGGQLPDWAFVSPNTGNDTTGNGTAAAPWATIQKAVATESKSFIVLGPGDAGSLSLTTTRKLCILGSGREVSSINLINVTGGPWDIYIHDLGGHSFTIYGGVQLTGAPGGLAGNLYMWNVMGGASVAASTGGNAVAEAAEGGSAGSIYAWGCFFSALSTGGGSGGPGTSEGPSGNGGNGGSVTAEYCNISSSISASPGSAGNENGGGGGSPGGNGSVTASFCTLGSYNAGSVNLRGNIIGGAWVDSADS